MTARRYVVTGGLGFLGAPLVRALVRAGHRVRVLDDSSRGSASRLEDLRADVEVVDGDVRDAETVARALRGMESVCHLAAINGTEHFYRHPGRVLEVGVKGMLNVVDGCRREGVGELILASSSEVYQTPPRVPTDETAPLVIPDPHNPRYSYGGSKIISELLALHYGAEWLSRVVICRPHNVFGPDMGWEHVIPQLTQRLAQQAGRTGSGPAPLTLQGDGSQTRAFMFIDDCVSAFLAVLERGEHRAVYHLGTMEETTIRDLAQRIARCMGMRVELIAGPEAPGGTRRRCPDTRKLQSLGFRPGFTLETALPPTVEWYRTHQPPASGAAVAAAEAGSTR